MTIIHALTLVAVLQATAGTQAPRPDFSGNWTLARDRSTQTLRGNTVTAVTGLLGEKFTAVQDAKTLTLEITVAALGRPVRAVYNLDGSESKNMNPNPGGGEDEPIFSRTSWEGDRLVILTRGTALVNGKPLESTRVIWIDTDGLLIIERSSEGAAATRSVYRRAQ
jgi:hypothetical protein